MIKYSWVIWTANTATADKIWSRISALYGTEKFHN